MTSVLAGMRGAMENNRKRVEVRSDRQGTAHEVSGNGGTVPAYFVRGPSVSSGVAHSRALFATGLMICLGAGLCGCAYVDEISPVRQFLGVGGRTWSVAWSADGGMSPAEGR